MKEIYNAIQFKRNQCSKNSRTSNPKPHSQFFRNPTQLRQHELLEIHYILMNLVSKINAHIAPAYKF